MQRGWRKTGTIDSKAEAETVLTARRWSGETLSCWSRAPTAEVGGAPRNESSRPGTPADSAAPKKTMSAISVPMRITRFALFARPELPL
jgi:hypothetical protein